jgi:2'-5' RNA ligase
MSEEIRAFVAVDPSEEARAELGRIQRALAEGLAGQPRFKVSFPKPENLHLTLRFLGNVSAERLDAIGTALAEVGGTDRFEIAFDTLGAFPDARRPRVLWIAPSRGDELKALAKRVDGVLAELGIPPEDRPWSPHLTLGRVRRAGRSADRVLETVSPRDAVTSPVTEVVLYRSELHPGGPRYTAIKRVPLTG